MTGIALEWRRLHFSLGGQHEAIGRLGVMSLVVCNLSLAGGTRLTVFLEAFEVDVFVSGFASSHRESASRSQRAFIRLAKGKEPHVPSIHECY